MNRRPELAGDLEFVPLADLLQVLGGNNCTGILHLSSEFSQTHGEIHFVSGEPVDAKWGVCSGMDALYSFFGWQQGRFEFRQQEFSGKRMIRKRRMEIVLDALRMLDDGLITMVGIPQRPVRHRFGSCSRDGIDLAVIKGSFIDYDCILSEERFEDRRRIVSEGSYGNWIWVILEGKALVTREKDGKEIPIIALGEGSFIGDLDVLLFGDHVRAATVTAVGEVQAALLDTHRLSTDFMSLSPEFRKSLLNMSQEVKEATDDLVGLLTEGGKYRQSVPIRTGGCDFISRDYDSESSHGAIRITQFEKERLEIQSFPDEFGILSRTFRSFIQCTADILLATTRRAWSIRNRSGDPGRIEPHRKAG